MESADHSTYTETGIICVSVFIIYNAWLIDYNTEHCSVGPTIFIRSTTRHYYKLLVL